MHPAVSCDRRTMNSVSPSSAQYRGMAPDEVLPADYSKKHLIGQSPSPRDVKSHFAHLTEAGRSSEPDEVDKIKAKFMSAWNNVKYGWTVKTKTNFNKTSPLTLLGRTYILDNEDAIDQFRKNFISLIWLTYRREFQPLEGSVWTTDCGWGCMLRSGQMLLAQGLLAHLLPSGWTWPDALQLTDVEMEALKPQSPSPSSPVLGVPHIFTLHSSRDQSRLDGVRLHGSPLHARSRGQSWDPEADHMHRRVIAWFGDHPNAPFSVHKLVEYGKSSGKKAGDWYGPSIVAHIIRKAVSQASELSNLVVYVAQDCTVYKGDVERLCESNTTGSSYKHSADGKSVIILVPVRLGGEMLNPIYKECVKDILRLDCCIGIIGGRPKHSLYFIGFQDDHLLYLDPHYCQAVVDITKNNFPLESFHCSSPRKVSFSRMDPSCTIGFYAKDKKDFESLCAKVTTALTSCSKEKYPIFTFAEGYGQDYGVDDLCTSSPDQASVAPAPSRPRMAKRASADDFVFL